MIDSSLYGVGMFLLTRREQMVLMLVLCSLLMGAGIRYWRMISALPGGSPVLSIMR
jgi:hypothetical protein